MKALLQLAKVETSDDLQLSGLYARGNNDRSACLIVHGLGGDFYSHSYYEPLADELVTAGHGFLFGQLRGTGYKTEFRKPEGNVSLGASEERLEDAHLDITAWIEFLLAQGYSSVTLIGHSLGTIKSIRYLFEGEKADVVENLVLLAPFDKNAFIEQVAPGKRAQLLALAESKVADGKGSEAVSFGGEEYQLGWRTFLSWYQDNDLSNIWDFHRADYDFPVLQEIDKPVMAIVGSNDEYLNYPQLGVSPATAFAAIEKYLPNASTAIIENCDHNFYGYESEVAKAAVDFIRG